MKKGLSLVELAQKIEANKELKQDYIAPTKALSVEIQSDNTPVLVVPHQGTFPIRPIAHGQIGTHLDIPKKYYDRMLAEQPALLADNINTWLKNTKADDKRMVRTLGGDARAFLSNRYNRIENEEIAEVALPIIMANPAMEVISCEVTERRPDRLRSCRW